MDVGKNAGNKSDIRPVIVYLSSDATTAARLEQAITDAGGHAVAAIAAEDFVAAIDFWFPVLGLLEIEPADYGPAGWEAAIRRCKLRPHTRMVPIVVMGHAQTGSGGEWQEAAHTAGADAVWPRAALLQQLDQVIRDHIDPPAIYPEGWDDRLSEKARKGVEEFNRGEFYEQHEWLEHAWMEETRPIREMYQGVLQVGVAFHHIEQGNWPGALKMFRRGLPRLRALPPVCQGIDIGALRAAAESIHREVTHLGRARLHEFDPRRFPKIRIIQE